MIRWRASGRLWKDGDDMRCLSGLATTSHYRGRGSVCEDVGNYEEKRSTRLEGPQVVSDGNGVSLMIAILKSNSPLLHPKSSLPPPRSIPCGQITYKHSAFESPKTRSVDQISKKARTPGRAYSYLLRRAVAVEHDAKLKPPFPSEMSTFSNAQRCVRNEGSKP
jgi:hypothetical protein